MAEQGKDWQTKAAQKRAKLLAQIPQELRLPEGSAVEDEQDVTKFGFSKYLDSTELQITETATVQELVDKLQIGKLTALQVATAFLKRAVIAQQLTRCLTEIFWDKALARAKELDKTFAETGPVGPLHGLPISLKDQLDVEGEELTLGYVGWIGRVSAKNAILVDLLLKAGAVVYVRTNIPQTLMIGESFNNVFGLTMNPRNRTLSPGGSSGGEGALIAMRGSVLGIGSDIGGSIRIPSSFNGLYGLRPSTNRIPYTGATNSMEGQEGVCSVFGPLSVSIDGLSLFMRSVIAMQPWNHDPVGVRMPWREEEYQLASHGGGKKLCFAILWDDGFAKPMPPYKRALQMTKDALIAAGHEVIDWEPYNHDEGWQILTEIWSADGGKDCNAARELSGEPPIRGVFTGDKEIGAYDFWQILRRKLKYTTAYVEHWNSTVTRTSTGRPVDAIIAPGNSNAPHPHYVGQSVLYTAIGNLNDWTAGVFPVTTVDPSLDTKPPAHEFHSKIDQSIYEAYDPVKYKNGPIGLQCIGRRYEEEAVLRMLEICDAAVKEHKSTHKL